MLVLAFPGTARQSQGELQYFPIASVKDFSEPEKALRALVQRDGKALVNHFCVVGVRNHNESDYVAKVYWRENKTLTLWDAGYADNVESLLGARRTWRLNRDIVTPEEASKNIGGFTLTQQEVTETLDQCKRVGQQFLIRKKTAKGNR